MNGNLLYSVADAPISWGSAMMAVPHLVVGALLLRATAREQVWLRGLSRTPGLLVQLAGGALFFGVAVSVLVGGIRATFACRDLVRSPELRTVTGPVVVEHRSYRLGNGHLRFSIAGEVFQTVTSGPGCDCGFLMPMGGLFALKEGQKMEAAFVGDVIVSLKRLDTAAP